MAAQTSAVVCIWCNRTISAAPAGAPVSHTICSTCVDGTLTHQGLAFDGTSCDVEYFELPPRPDNPGRTRPQG